jgi:hypothetical protein
MQRCGCRSRVVIITGHQEVHHALHLATGAMDQIHGALLSTCIALHISSLRDSVERLVCMLRMSPLREGQVVIVSG